MKILVTGCAGFIGANVCEYFINKGYEVVGIDNFNDYYPRKIKEFNIESIKNSPQFKLVEGDITNRKLIKTLFETEKFVAVIHLAAWAGVTSSVTEPSIYINVNIDGTNNLLEFGVKNDLKTIIFASTSSVYGNNNKTPFTEDMNTDFPAAPYPASKKACEVLLYTYNLNFGLNVYNFRIFNPVGPKMRPDLALPKLIRSAIYGHDFPLFMDPNSSLRDYAYVEQMIEVFDKSLTTQQGYQILNLGNSNPRSLIELKEIVENITNKKINVISDYKPGQMIETYANIDKAKNILGYDPKYKLEEMVQKYYDWFIEQPEWYKKGEY